MHKYKDIPVTPFTELLAKPAGLSEHKGGPVWPDWDKAHLLRHQRRGCPVDSIPEIDRSLDLLQVDNPLYWCGPISGHYGHQIAEFSSRAVMYNTENDRAFYCFATHMNSRIRSLKDSPDYFRQLLKWYGIPENRVFMVTDAILAKELHVIPQQEQLNMAPTPELLDRLDQVTAKNGYEHSSKNGTYYISRAGIPKGKVAGEAYFEYVLGLCGVKVIRPETISLLEQLRIYSSAQKLIFSEGSALHTLQLLGRSIGEVFVLNRRSNASLARLSLAPRARKVTYMNIGASIDGFNPYGTPARYLGICIPDEKTILESFTVMGLKLEHWCGRTFKMCVQQDIHFWLNQLKKQSKIDNAAFKKLMKPIVKSIRKLKYKT